MQNVYLVMSIIKKSEAELFSDFFLKFDVAPLYSTICQGAAHQSKLELFGLQKSEKVLIQSIVPEDKVKELMYRLTHEMKIDLPDKGVAIAIPLSSIASRKVYEKIISTIHEEDITHKDKYDNERKQNMELIVAICAKGNTDAIMTLAREAGATGGTIIKAKGTARAGTDRFFGMSISDEKEILYIVAKAENKSAIMKAIAGYTYDENAHPVAFSLPITESAGFRLMD